MLAKLIAPPLLGLQFCMKYTQKQVGFGPGQLRNRPQHFAFKWVTCEYRRVRAMCACSSIGCFLHPHVCVMYACASMCIVVSARARLVCVRVLWCIPNLCFFMHSPLCMLFYSFLPSNTCLVNLKSLNTHIKASNGIKVNQNYQFKA